MSKIRNFFLDIDGTMLIRGKKQLTDELITALHYARAKGCKIFVNTGRTKSFLPYSIAKLDFSLAK
jgi:hydroxymethylpyrimidine pyrophosphatase-like HAD family hydrolase